MHETTKTALLDGQGTEAERRSALNVAAQAFLPPQSQALARAALAQPHGPTFEAMERPLLAEARAHAATSGKLVPFSYRDDGGRKITTFEGDPAAWMGAYTSPGQRARINRQAVTEIAGKQETVFVPRGKKVAFVDE